MDRSMSGCHVKDVLDLKFCLPPKQRRCKVFSTTIQIFAKNLTKNDTETKSMGLRWYTTWIGHTIFVSSGLFETLQIYLTPTQIIAKKEKEFNNTKIKLIGRTLRVSRRSYMSIYIITFNTMIITCKIRWLQLKNLTTFPWTMLVLRFTTVPNQNVT